MPCSLCKNRDHVLSECNHVSIANTIYQIRLRCIESIGGGGYGGGGGVGVGADTRMTLESATASLSILKDYVNRLSCSMLKSILYKIMFFKPIPTREYNFDPTYNYHKGCDYYNGSGSKIVLVGKVMNLFLSNIRREYSILFFKQSPRFRKVYFEQEIYWDQIAGGYDHAAAKEYAVQHMILFETFYSQWVIHLKRDLEKLIKQCVDHFSAGGDGGRGRGDMGVYNLHTMRDNERILHESYLQGNNSVYLRGINYNEREAYYLKKKLMEHMIMLYGDAMEYSYNENEDIQLRVHRVFVIEPDQQLLLSQPRRLPLIRPRSPDSTADLHNLLALLYEINNASMQQQQQQQQHMSGRSAVSIQQNIDYLQQVLIEYENQAPVIRQHDRRPVGLRKFNIVIALENVEHCSDFFDCAVCLDSKTGKDGHLVFSCKHEFCGTCTNQYLEDYRAKTTDPCCPLCRGKIGSIVVKNSDMLENKGIFENLQNICSL